MTFTTYSAAQAYLDRSGRRGQINSRTYRGNGYDFTEYEVIFW